MDVSGTLTHGAKTGEGAVPADAEISDLVKVALDHHPGVVKLADLTNVSWDQVYVDPSLEQLRDDFGFFALRPFSGVDDPERQQLIAFAEDGELVAVVSSRLDIQGTGGEPLGRRAAIEAAPDKGDGGPSSALHATEHPSNPLRSGLCGTP